MSADWEAGRLDKVARSLRSSFAFVSLFFWGLSCAGMIVAPILFDQLLQGRYSDGLAIMPMALVHCSFATIAMILQIISVCRTRPRHRLYACPRLSIESCSQLPPRSNLRNLGSDVRNNHLGDCHSWNDCVSVTKSGSQTRISESRYRSPSLYAHSRYLAVHDLPWNRSLFDREDTLAC